MPTSDAVAPGAQVREVGGAAAAHVARALDEVGAVLEGADKAVHLARVGAAVRVDHHDDLARCRREPGTQRGALAPAELVHDDDVGAGPAGEDARGVGRSPSTRTTSVTHSGRCSSTHSRLPSSLSVGITTLTVASGA